MAVTHGSETDHKLNSDQILNSMLRAYRRRQLRLANLNPLLQRAQTSLFSSCLVQHYEQIIGILSSSVFRPIGITQASLNVLRLQ